MTSPGGESPDQPREQPAPAPGSGYEPPPIEQMNTGGYDTPPGSAYPPPGGYPPPPGPGGYPPPPGFGSYPPPPEYGAYPPPPPGYGAQPYPAPNQAPGYGDYAPARAGTNPMAIGSLVASAVGLLCGIGSIIGIVLGIVALNQIKKTGQGGHGLAVGGIVLGVASFAISLIAAIYMSR